jgi:hypothetical protein
VVRRSFDEPVESSQDEQTDSVVEELLKVFIREALLQADDLDQLDIWLGTTDFVYDRELLFTAVDRIIYKENPPAWETLAYLLPEGSTIEDLRTMYVVGKHDVQLLGSYLTVCEGEDNPTSFALWRIWAYCMLSMESFIHGDCCTIQAAWLGGPTSDRALLGKPNLDLDETLNWKLCTANGIFAQCNEDLSIGDIDDMIRIWDLLGQKWSDVVMARMPSGLEGLYKLS